MPDGVTISPETAIGFSPQINQQPHGENITPEPTKQAEKGPELSIEEKREADKLLEQIMKETSSETAPEIIPDQQEVAKETKKPQGFLAKIWQWLKRFFSLTK